MKKVLSVLLCAVIAFSCCMIAEAQEDDSPVILVSGFLEPPMSINIDKVNEEQLFPPAVTTVAGRIIADTPDLVSAIFGLIYDRAEVLGAQIGGGIEKVLEKLKCNPDGSTIYEVETFPNDPALCNMKYLMNHKNGKYIAMVDFAKDISSKMDPEKVFVFSYDSRKDSLTIAAELREFIKSVKDYTKAGKVRLCSHSYGGQILASYFYRYVDDGDVRKAVMIYPALAGTDAIGYLLGKSVEIPLDDIAIFGESLLRSPTELADIFKGGDFTALNRGASESLYSVGEVWQYWSSMYSLCSTEYYEKIKNDILDPVEAAEMIRANDEIHYSMMPNLRNIFAGCQNRGIDVSIICGSGRKECMGGKENSDILLPASLVSGATCADIGEHFEDGYEAEGTVCNNRKHNHISPNVDIDASTGFLPDNTWFIEGAFHGAYPFENYALSLIEELLLTDNLKDVYSDPDYPQFEFSDNINMGIHFSFNDSSTGYISSDDTGLVIRNLNKVSSVRILSIKADGLDIEFDTKNPVIIMPGKSATIRYDGRIPKVRNTGTAITVEYAEGLKNTSTTRGFNICN